MSVGLVTEKGNTMDTIREIAEAIADSLMTNGNEERAERLVLELPDGRDGGGWCRSSVVSTAENELLRQAKKWMAS